MISYVSSRVHCLTEIQGSMTYALSLRYYLLIEWCLGPLEHMPLHGVNLCYFVVGCPLLSYLYLLIKVLSRYFYS